MNKLVLNLLFVLASSQVMAVSNISGTSITNIMQDSNFPEYMFLDLSGEPTSQPACHTHPTFEYVIDLTSDFGKRVQSLALSAFIAKQDVTVVGAGDGNCNANGIELLRRLDIK